MWAMFEYFSQIAASIAPTFLRSHLRRSQYALPLYCLRLARKEFNCLPKTHYFNSLSDKSNFFNLTTDPLSLGIIVINPELPSFDLPTPNFAWSSNLNPVPGSGLGTAS